MTGKGCGGWCRVAQVRGFCLRNRMVGGVVASGGLGYLTFSLAMPMATAGIECRT